MQFAITPGDKCPVIYHRGSTPNLITNCKFPDYFSSRRFQAIQSGILRSALPSNRRRNTILHRSPLRNRREQRAFGPRQVRVVRIHLTGAFGRGTRLPRRRDRRDVADRGRGAHLSAAKKLQRTVAAPGASGERLARSWLPHRCEKSVLRVSARRRSDARGYETSGNDRLRNPGVPKAVRPHIAHRSVLQGCKW